MPPGPSASTTPTNSSATSPVVEAALRDQQALLGDAVRRLRASTRCPSVWAWSLRDDGAPYVVAADFTGPPPPCPSSEDFEVAAALDRSADLAHRNAPPALVELGERHRAAAATAIRNAGAEVLAVLLVGATAEPPRPRVFAALDATARRLAAPLATALATRRLARLDVEVRRLDRLATLGSLAVEIAHEVRNPLVSVKTLLELLPERANDAELMTRFLAVVNEEVRRMERLLDLVLRVPAERTPAGTSSEAGCVTTVMVSLGDLLAHGARKRGVELRAEVGEGIPDVSLSEDALRQALLNLALNAIRATPAGGSVSLRARADGPASVVISVEDDGPGVPPELRERIFEPFFSTRLDEPGGLGLAITRRIVTEAGGEIVVGEGERGGAEFKVRLPVH